MSVRSAPVSDPGVADKNLVLDELSERLDALRVLRADNPDEAGSMLEQIGASGKVEQEIVFELSAIKPLWLPDRFEQAHRMIMRALEVIDRNGARGAKLPNLGPIKPVAQWLVQLFTRLIVRNYQQKVIDKIGHLYSRREANSVWGSPEHRMLRRARIDAERVGPGLKGKALGLPTFLVGGAFISTITRGLTTIGGSATEDKKILMIVSIVLGVLFAAISWVVLYAASVARRRIRLTIDQPIRALFETIGAAGDVPRDDSMTFALIALIFTLLAGVVVPVVITAFFL